MTQSYLFLVDSNNLEIRYRSKTIHPFNLITVVMIAKYKMYLAPEPGPDLSYGIVFSESKIP